MMSFLLPMRSSIGYVPPEAHMAWHQLIDALIHTKDCSSCVRRRPMHGDKQGIPLPGFLWPDNTVAMSLKKARPQQKAGSLVNN